jgi:hypothetical protein
MPNQAPPGEKLDQLDSLLARWQTSLDLHATYAALDEDRYWHVQPWPRHERPQRWIIQLARKRILALRRLVAQRQAEGDRAFVEGIEIMGFLSTLVGVTSLDRYIPLATPETERRDVLSADKSATPDAQISPKPRPSASRERDAASRTGEHRRSAETTRQMPQLPKSLRAPVVQRATVPAREAAASPPARRREPSRTAVPRPRKPPNTVTQTEHVVIADAVRLLGWGRQWHELADMIARLAERPAPSEIRRILRTYREQIDAVAKRRNENK